MDAEKKKRIELSKIDEKISVLKYLYESLERKCKEYEEYLKDNEKLFGDDGYGNYNCCEDCHMIKNNGDLFSYEGPYSCPAEFDPNDPACFFYDEFDYYVKKRKEAEEFLDETYEETFPLIEINIAELELSKSDDVVCLNMEEKK